MRNIRDSIHSLGVVIADDASLQTLFSMRRKLFPVRESRREKTGDRLRGALARLRLQESGRKSDLAQRLRNAFNSCDNEEKTPFWPVRITSANV